MPPIVALCLWGVFTIWLFWTDRKNWIQGSRSLWIPLLWLIIIGGRPLTSWLGFGGTETADGEMEGSPLDRTIFLGLIACGIMVLATRPVDWPDLLQKNKWLWAFYLFLGVSVVWSDYSFVSFKRWVKDLGNVVMVLIVLTDRNPPSAVRTLLARCAYLLIPLSVVLIKYYPGLGTSYDRWSGEAAYVGASSNKNMLGMVLFTTAVSLTWMWTRRRALGMHSTRRAIWIPFFLLTPMLLWLLQKTHSATALVCATIGVTVLAATQLRAVRARTSLWGPCLVGGLLALAVLQSVFDLRALAFGTLGREVTLTGRTDIWRLVLAEGTNPFLGAGFYSFWLGDRNERVSRGYDYLLGTAHNGYLEVYLNSGLIGLGLLLCLMAHAFKRSKQMVAKGLLLGDLNAAALVGASIYAMTEAVINRQSVVWFLWLLAMVDAQTRLAPASLAPGHDAANEPPSRQGIPPRIESSAKSPAVINLPTEDRFMRRRRQLLRPWGATFRIDGLRPATS